MANLYFNGYVSGEWTDNIVDQNSGAIIYTNFTANYSPTSSDNVEILSSSPYSTVTIHRSNYDHTSTPVATRDLTVDSGITLIEENNGALTVNGVFTNSGVFIRNTSGGPLKALGGAIVNNGLITINGVYDYDGMLIAPGSTSLSGSGNLRLRGADLTISDPNGIAYLANASTISGSGIIGQAGNNNYPDGPVVLENTASGVVDADVDGQTLQISAGTTPAVNPTTNSGLFEASGGGELLFFNTNLDQSGSGTLAAYGAGSTVVLAGIRVRGGFIDGSDGGIVENGGVGGNSGDQPDTIDGRSTADGGLGAVTIKSGAILKSVGSGLILVGSIVNSGEIIDHNALTVGAGDLTLSGGGSFVMDYPGDNYDSSLNGYSSSVTSTIHNVNDRISGAGIINVAIDNQANGAVVASNADRTLQLNSIAVSNAGDLQSSLGSLEIYASTITQSGTGAIVADGGNGSTAHVDLYGGTTIVGGKLDTENGGIIETGLAGVGFGTQVTLDGSTAAGEVANLGTLIDKSEPLIIKGTLANVGTLSVQNGLTGNSATLTGGGKVVLGDSGAVVSGALVNTDNTISGAGTFANGLMLNNGVAGTIDASSSAVQMVIQTVDTVTNAGLIEATGSAGLDLSNLTVDDRSGGRLAVGDGSVVDLDTATVLGGSLTGTGSGSFKVTNAGNSFSYLANTSIAATVDVVGYTVLYAAGTISNTGQIVVDSAHSGASATLNVAGIWTGGGRISLSDDADNILGVYGSFTNGDNTIAGAGSIQGTGGSPNTFTNDGTVDATDADNALTIGTGSTVTNNGVLEAQGGVLVVNDAVSGSGSVVVSGNGNATFNAAMQQGVAFVGANAGRLTLAQSDTGPVSGFAAGDSIDLVSFAFAAGDTAAWTQNTAGTGGVLSMIGTDGSVTPLLDLVGQYRADDFHFADDGHGDLLLTSGGPSLTTSTLQEGFGVAQVAASIAPDGALVLAAPDGTDTLHSVTRVRFNDAVDVVSGNTITQYNADGSYSASTFNITGAGYTGTVYTYNKDGTLRSARYNGVSDQAYQSYQANYDDGTYTGTQYFYTGITGQAYTTETLSVNAAGQQTSVVFGGVTGASYSSYEYDFASGLFAGSKFTITAVPAGASYSSYEVNYDYANTYLGAQFFFTGLTGQPYTGEEVDTDPTGATTRVLLTGFTGQPYQSLALDYTGGTYTDYKVFETGVTGQSYTGLEEDVTAAGALTKVVYTGLHGTPYSMLEQDYAGGVLSSSTFTFEAPAGQSYTSYSVTEDAAGSQISETVNNSNGGHTILGSAPNLIFDSIGNDTITGGGSGETFSFNNVFGHDTIRDFSGHITGAGHDTIDLSAADFGSFDAVAASAQNVSGGVAFTGKSGSQITLVGLDKNALGGLGADFRFHA